MIKTNDERGRPTILLANELGGNSGHVTALSTIAQALLEKGFRCVAAVPNLERAEALGRLNVPLLQAPIWPGWFRGASGPIPAPTPVDLLLIMGLDNPVGVHRMAQAWRILFKTTGASALIADHAPMLCIAGHGQLPTIALGTTSTLPPSGIDNWRKSHRVTNAWDEPTLCARLNPALTALGRRPLTKIADIFEVDLAIVKCAPLLDVYAPARAGAKYAAIKPQIAAREGNVTAIYLAQDFPATGVVLEWARNQVHSIIYAANTSHALKGNAPSENMRVLAAPLPIEELLDGAAICLHSGGANLCTEALTAGVPQVILYTQAEQMRNAHRLQNEQVAIAIDAKTVSVSSLQAQVSAFLARSDLRSRCLQVGQEQRAKMTDASSEVTSYIEALEPTLPNQPAF